MPQHVTFQLKGMKKPQRFIIYPIRPGDKQIVIQSEQRIARIDPETGKGMLSKAHPNGPYFPHLNRDAGAYEIELTKDQLTELKLQAVANGSTINVGNIMSADNSGISNLKF